MDSIMKASESIGIYIHIPYCARRCLYCDFYSEGAVRADWPRYVTALLTEFRNRLAGPEGNPLRQSTAYTLYIGGGTPSLIPPAEFRRLADGIPGTLGREPSEFTIEVNPDDVTVAMADVWATAGVDRVSMGVQSLVNPELKAIGRRHDSATARRAYDILRSRFDNISLDLMFGLPGQTPDSLAVTLDGFMTMSPEHISAYSLMFEERTALTRLRDMGRVREADEQDSVAMFRMISSRLAETGFEQYEISNYARPGFRSRHNSDYWQGLPYIGLGPGAHSFDGHHTRAWNRSDARAYMSAMEHGCDRLSVVDSENLTEEEQREEMIMTRLRTSEGLDLQAYGERFGLQALVSLTARAKPIAARGLLRLHGSRLTLTASGIMISDDIISDLF